MTDSDRLLTVRQVSKLLQISTQSVRDWVNKGKIPAFKLNARVWRIKESDIKQFITKGATR